MAAVTGLTLIKRFPYRGDPNEEFSNTYHLIDPPPGDDASWKLVAQDIWNHEKLIHQGTVHWTRAYGYDSDDPHAHAVWSWDLGLEGVEQPGTMAIGGTGMAGDQAAVAYWKTDRKNSKGKTIYLRKYFHHGIVSVGNVDELDNSYWNLLGTFAENMKAGGPSNHGGVRARAWTANIVFASAMLHVTTRTLHRRGKRPLAHTMISSA